MASDFEISLSLIIHNSKETGAIKQMKLSQTGVGLLILVVAAASSGCSLVNRLRAKNELNEAVRENKAGHFPEAVKRARQAQAYDPTNKNALFIIARSLHSQYRPGVESEANKKIAQDAVDAYKQVLEQDTANDKVKELAYSAIAALLGALKQDINHNPDGDTEGKGQREWIAKRATDESVPAAKRAEAYTVLASKDWDCSYRITELPDSKQNVRKDDKVTIVYKKPKEQKDFDAAKMCVTRGLEEVENAIRLDPNNESAWSYKTNLLLENVKLAEMEGNNEQKTQFQKEAQDAQNRTTELSKRREEEEARRPTPTPGG